MSINQNDLLSEFNENIKFDYNLKKRNWFNIGGNAKIFYKAENLKELQASETKGLAALNEVIINALNLVPACLEFLECLENQQVFRFCAIPQLMAIATLEELFDNKKVLHENVKIRKGKTAKYFMSIQDFDTTKKEFTSILKKMEKKDKTGQIKSILKKIK